jgi:hypothetical protein
VRVITERGRVGGEAGSSSSDETDRQEQDLDAVLFPGPLQIVVPGAGLELTRAAVDAVADLAKNLQAGATLVSVQVVPFTLPLDNPPISSRFYRRCLEEIVSRIPMPLRIELLLARDQESALRQFMPKSSPVLVVARRRRWWRKSAEERLASALRRAGHKVALIMI